MIFSTIKCEVKDRIFTITLNRPNEYNAVNDDMRRDLLNVFDQVDQDDEIRVVIVTGAGRAFCAGADLDKADKTFDYAKQGRDDTLETHRDFGGLLTLKIYDLKKPVIAAINGAAVGVGITMALPMDVRLASENAKIGFPFARRGIVNEACSSWFLPRIVGISNATEWVLTGRIFSAQEALSRGLISEILSPEALLPRARQIATEMLQTSAVSVALCRQLLWKMLGTDHPMEAHKLDSKYKFWMGKGPDAKEGILSFLEKREPNFTMQVSKDMPSFYPWWMPRKFD